jgi:hypothetical protein
VSEQHNTSARNLCCVYATKPVPDWTPPIGDRIILPFDFAGGLPWLLPHFQTSSLKSARAWPAAIGCGGGGGRMPRRVARRLGRLASRQHRRPVRGQ